MSSSHAMRRRQFLLQMLGSIGACAGVASLARAAGGGAQRGIIDRLASPSLSARGIELAGDGYRTIKSLGLPDHLTGDFPNPHCPGRILAQNHDFRVLTAPAVAPSPTPLDGWIFGVAVNGVVFDPSGPYYFPDPNTRSSWEFEVLSSTARPSLGIDDNNAHTQPSGEYHYHGMPQGLLWGLQRDRIRRGEPDSMILLGWAADGFPVYASSAPSNPLDPSSPMRQMRPSYVLGSDKRTGAAAPGGYRNDHGDGLFVQDYDYHPGTGDLDDCNGRYGITPEYPKGTYHYFITSAFPFVPRQWRGKPDASFWHPSPGYDAIPPELRALKF